MLESSIDVIIIYAILKTLGRFTISTKYHGIAIMLIPCAKPEIIFERKRNVIACLFFISAKIELIK